MSAESADGLWRETGAGAGVKPQGYVITGSPIHRIREHGSWWLDAKPDGFTAKARQMTVPSEDVAMATRAARAHSNPAPQWRRRDDR